MTIDDMIDSMDKFKDVLERIDQSEPAAVKFALAHCVRALRYAMDADGLSPDRRKAARSSYLMGCAALGIEEVA